MILMEENLLDKYNQRHSGQNIFCYLITTINVVIGLHSILMDHFWFGRSLVFIWT